jgi:catechol 2,3-dioxygenase-like lactoylglutathione lyase family enzyme
MIFGAHVIVYSKDPEPDRAFFRDVLGFKSVDALSRLADLRPSAGRSRIPPIR